MTNIVFEERAVAFLDVLGFSDLVRNAAASVTCRAKLQALVGLLETAIPVLDSGVSATVSRDLYPKHIYISDSIILSAPLQHPAMRSYRGLEIVVMRCIQLTHKFLEAGYLLRGGIAVGHVWHSDANIVGPAYQEAVGIEKSTEKPRIQLSDGAKELWRKGSGASSRMCVINQESIIVNGLLDFYIEDQTHGGVERAYERYANIVAQQIASNTEPRPNAKWQWFQAFLDGEASADRKWPRPA